MAHILLLRVSPSFVQSKDAIYGVHEEVELNINKRKYEVEGGYNIPFSSEYKLLDYRQKEEVVPRFVNDLCGPNYILNPKPNNISLKQVLWPRKNHKTATVGRILLFIQWLFKWINRKYTTSLIFTILYILQYIIGVYIIGGLGLLIVISLLLMNPLRPVPVIKEKRNKFNKGWDYTFCIGMLKDISEVIGLKREGKQNDAL